MKTLIVCIIGVAALLTGCGGSIIIGSGRVATENRSVSNFNAVSLSGFGDLIITQGEIEALTVEVEDNLLPYIRTEVRNGTLSIGVENRSGPIIPTPTKLVRYNLTVKDLQAVDLSGAGSIRSASLKSDNLKIGISGAGNVTLDHVEAASLTSILSGAGGLKLSGQVTNQTATLSGVGGYDAPDLSSKSTRIMVSGLGGATVWAIDSLDVTISGAGSVSYYGNPRLQQTTSGAGGVKSLGSK